MCSAEPGPGAERGGRGRPLPGKQPEEARALYREMAAGEPVGGVQTLIPSYCKKGVNL